MLEISTVIHIQTESPEVFISQFPLIQTSETEKSISSRCAVRGWTLVPRNMNARHKNIKKIRHYK